MIEFIDKDIFDVHTDGLIHQCNCFHTMGAGIARTVKELFPEAYRADLATGYGDSNKLGTFSMATTQNGEYAYISKVINLYGQFRYGRDKRYTDYNALADGLKLIAVSQQKERETRLTIPFKMGCNNAGGDWKIVLAIIQSVFEYDKNFRILICQQ